MLEFVATEPLSTTIEVDSPGELEDVVRRLRDSGVPDEEIHIGRASRPDGEVTDSDMSWSVRLGLLAGIPGVYVIVTVMSLIAGTTLTEALWIGLIPAVFCGWFVAGFVFLNTRVGAIESAGHVVREHEVDEIVVTGPHAAEARQVIDLR